MNNLEYTLDIIHQKTRRRPYVLLVMPSMDAQTGAEERLELFESIQKVVEEQFNFACLRADQVLGSGHELLGKIHLLIESATLVIAEISEPRPNVFYELGYAMAVKKTPILLLEKGKGAPYDLQGLEVFEYENTRDGIDTFRDKLKQHLNVRLHAELPILRTMVGAAIPEPSYIVASPSSPDKDSRIIGQVFDSRTFGDHLGILGLISAFGSMYGDAKAIELISARHAPPDLLRRDINLYLIGSGKVNPWTGKMLERLQNGNDPQWLFKPISSWKQGETGDWPAGLFRREGKHDKELIGDKKKFGNGLRDFVWTLDYGILVRGPHPLYPQRLVLILAGPHSLGTAAASLMATRPSLIKELQKKLPAGILEDKGRTFWALVKGRCNPKDYLIDESGVSIEEVGVVNRAT